MPNAIERDVYVLRNTLKNPIAYVRGTDLLPIIFHFRDFTIPSGATATAFTAKPDGNAVYGSAVISGNDVTIDVTQQMFIVLGMSMLQVEIKEGEETLTTFIQPVMVEPNLKAGDLPESTTDIEFLDEAIEQAQEAVKDAQQAIADANTAISGANTAAESANSAAQNANNATEELQDKVDAGDFTASVQVGTTTTLPPGQDATVSNSGTNKDAVFNFGIPKGDPGTAASIQVGTTQTVQPEENAEVINTGTTTAAVLNFKIPRGEDGMTDLVARYEGASEYTATPTADAPIVINDLNGKTQQIQTNGYQLFDASKLPSKTQGGATVTNNGDGSFTISGSGNLSENFKVNYRYSHLDSIKILSNKAGLINIKFEKVTYPYCYMLFNTDRYLGEVDNASSGTTKFEITEEMLNNENFYIEIGFNGAINSTIVPGTIKPMLYQSGDGTWEPYTGGQPAPSPDYPQVIKGVGGMGYFDGEWRQGVYQSSNGAWQAAGNGICSQSPIKAKAGDNVTLKYPDEATLVILAYKSDGTYLGNNAAQNANEVSYTLPTDTAYVHIDVQMAQGVSLTPSTAKYCTVEINGEYQTGVEVTGKNLAEVSRENLNITLLNIPEFKWTGKKQVYIKYSAKTNQASGEIAIFVNYKDKSRKVIGVNGKEFTPGVDFKETSLFFTGINAIPGSNNLDLSEVAYMDANIAIQNASATQFSVKDLMISDSDLTNIDYTPYHHTSLSIPLTSPLYEGDKICYVKPGESYADADGDTVIADRILYGCYRENAEVVFDGSSDENWGISSAWGNNRYYINLNNSNNIYTENTAKCIFFKYNTNVYIDSNDEIGFIVAGDKFYCRFSSASEINSVSNLKTWLQSNPLTVVYRLAQPYFEPFSDQSIFYGLRTDDTLSYVYSSDPIEPVLTVEVAKNSTGGYLLESYAQAQKNAISEANSQSRLSAIEQQLVNQATAPTE